MVFSLPGNDTTRDPLASVICNADSCATGTGRPSARCKSTTLRKSSDDCLRLGDKSNVSEPSSVSAVFRATAADTVLLCVGIMDRPARYNRDGELTLMHFTGATPAGS